MKNLPNPKQSIFLSLGFLAASAFSAPAALIAYENFESYTSGDAISGKSGGDDWTGNWEGTGGSTVVTGAIAGFGKGLSITDDNSSEAAIRAFGDESATVYAGYLLRVTDFGTNEFFQSYFTTTNGDKDSGGSIGIINTGSNEFFARIGNNGLGTDRETTPSATTATDGQVYQLVVKLSKNSSSQYNVSELFIDQLSEGTPDAKADITTSDRATSFQRFGFRTAVTSTSSTETIFIDELRIATTYAEALAVPEPSAAALAMLGGLLAFRRRRPTALSVITMKKSLLSTGVLLSFAALSDAALIAYDGFENGGFDGGTGDWVGNWGNDANTTVATASLSFSAGDVTVSGGSNAVRYLSTGSGSGNERWLARVFSPQGLSQPVYYSFLVQQSADGSSDSGSEDFLSAYPDSNSLSETDANDYGLVFRQDSGTRRFGVRSGDNGNQNFVSTVTPSIGTTNFVVVKFDPAATHQVTLWVDPDSTSEAGGTNATRSQSDTGGTAFSTDAFNRLALRNALLEEGDTYLVDEFRIGTTFSSVVVPEPSGVLLGCLGFGLIAFRRSRPKGGVPVAAG